MHENQITLSERTVRALVTEQFPQWAAEPLRRVDSSGTVNTIVRIGEHHAARFPLLGTDPEATLSVLEAEARAAEEFAGHCPFPAPLPVGIGAPGHGYPLPWSVQTWLPGTVATDDDPARSDDVARDLAALITALRGVDTHGRTFGGANRGGELGDHDKSVRTHLSRSGHLLDVGRLTALWRHFRELPPTGPDVMTHGDLIPPNLLVTQRRLVGVLDCGGFAAADPALDLIVAWSVLDDRPRGIFRAELRCDDLEWERGIAWAFEQAVGLVEYYAMTNPVMSRLGRRTLSRIVAATTS